jgi:hypothetical protein
MHRYQVGLEDVVDDGGAEQQRGETDEEGDAHGRSSDRIRHLCADATSPRLLSAPVLHTYTHTETCTSVFVFVSVSVSVLYMYEYVGIKT